MLLLLQYRYIGDTYVILMRSVSFSKKKGISIHRLAKSVGLDSLTIRRYKLVPLVYLKSADEESGTG